MLLLLEVHGTPAREAAFERLSHSLGPAVGEEEWFFRRNLLYLLRRVPRAPESAPLDVEVDLVLQHARMGLPLVVVKEAVAALGPLKDERTEIGLAQLMADLEGLLVKPGDAPPYDAKELRILLDRVAATLARLPSRPARRTLIEHAGRKQAQLGEHDGARGRAWEPGPLGRSADHRAVARDGQANMPQASQRHASPRPEPRAPDRGVWHACAAVRRLLGYIVARFETRRPAGAASRRSTPSTSGGRRLVRNRVGSP